MHGLEFTQAIAIWAIPIIFAVTVHEAAHAWVAHKLGDNTALMVGRLSFNPLKHIDPIGTILVPVTLLYLGGFIFGWAKPVPINTRNLKNVKKDSALIAFAGPLSNIIMAILWGALLKISFIFYAHYPNLEPLILMSMAGITINSVLAVLNLIPIPPLDGSQVLSCFLPANIAIPYERIAPYGFFILLGLLFLGILAKILLPIVIFLQQIIFFIFKINIG